MLEATSQLPVLLLAFADARQNQALPQLHQERNALCQALESAEQAGLCEVIILPNVNSDNLIGHIQEIWRPFGNSPYSGTQCRTTFAV